MESWPRNLPQFWELGSETTIIINRNISVWRKEDDMFQVSWAQMCRCLLSPHKRMKRTWEWKGLWVKSKPPGTLCFPNSWRPCVHWFPPPRRTLCQGHGHTGHLRGGPVLAASDPQALLPAPQVLAEAAEGLSAWRAATCGVLVPPATRPCWVKQSRVFRIAFTCCLFVLE